MAVFCFSDVFIGGNSDVDVVNRMLLFHFFSSKPSKSTLAAHRMLAAARPGTDQDESGQRPILTK